MTKSALIFIVAVAVWVSLLNIALYGVIGVFAGPMYLAIGYAYFFALNHLRRPPTPATMSKLKTLSFHTRTPPAAAVRGVAAYAHEGSYRIKRMDEANGWILLSQPASVFSPAVYLPIQVTSSPYPGWYRVDVGVRVMGYPGLLRSDLTPRLQTCADNVEHALAMESPANQATA